MDWKRIREVFQRALEVEPARRQAFVAEACRGDDDLRRQVEAMLAARERIGGALDSPAVATTEVVATPGDRAPAAGRNERAAAHLAAGTVVDGKYRLDGLLGAGGMGAVYRAWHLQLERAVALKTIRGELLGSRATAERFRREAVAVARLRHPHIVAVYDYGVAEGAGAYLVMELLEGRSLREELAERGPLGPERALAVVAQTCAAVGAAHRAGVVHRDLKPDNIFLERRDGSVSVKVVDFGVARLEAAVQTGALTAEGALLGTPAYMSPEQCRGEEADARSDVYSLGCVFYEMLTGERPFAGKGAWSLVYQHVNEEPRRPREVAPELAPEVEAALLRALAKDPAERFQSAEALAEALGASGATATLAGGMRTDAPAGGAAVTARAEGAPTARSAASPETNLPHALTSFVGRDREIEEVRAWLRRTRLVTLVGPGGIGKTRLAIETAWRAVSDYAGGVWLVELASLADPALVARAVSSALGVREQHGRSDVEALEEWLRDRRLLLVLDNCEHLVDACAQLAERLLKAAAGLRVLATSREALGMAGEAAWPVPALGVGEPGGGVVSEAARLFADRASLARPGWEAGAGEAADVAELCRRLEGIPLAIELAAARVRALTVRQVLDRLDDRFRLLASGSRGAPTRQQTLRATLDWSYDLLNERERALLRRLSVFSGGWTAGAAEAVWGDPEVVDLLARLVDKSVMFAGERGGATRYGMLETVREYAIERLGESGEADEAARRHADYFLELAEAADAKLVGPEAATWLALLDAEHDNLQAAFAWLLEREPERCLRLAAALANFWYLHGHYRQGRRWLDAALERSPSSPAATMAKVLVGAGLLARQQGEMAAARDYFERGLRAGREAGDEVRIAWSSLNLGVMVMSEGDLRAARAYAEETLASATASGLDQVAASSNMLLGEVSRLEADWAGARPFYERALELNRRIGHQEGVSVTLNNLGATLCELGDLDGAHACYREALLIGRGLGITDNIAYSLDGLGAAAARRGEWERAARLAGAADALRESIGSEMDPADRSMRDRYLGEVREHLGEAALEAALAEGRATERDRTIDEALST